MMKLIIINVLIIRGTKMMPRTRQWYQLAKKSMFFTFKRKTKRNTETIYPVKFLFKQLLFKNSYDEKNIPVIFILERALYTDISGFELNMR